MPSCWPHVLPTCPLLRVCQAPCRPISPFGCSSCDSLPSCPVDEQDEHVSVVTNNPNRFCTASCGLQHIATQRDVRLIMGDETVKIVNELPVTL